MRKLYLTLVILTLAFLPFTSIHAQTNELERATPESQGIPSEAVLKYFDYITSLQTTEMHGAILMRHGKVIGEIHPKPFRAECGHALFSCSKTFVAAAIGLAINENRLRVTDRLANFFPELLPERIDEDLADVTIHDLLTMQAGFKPTDDIRNCQTEWIKGCLHNKMFAKPGTRFAYDSMNTYLLSAIITKVTGQTVLEYLKPRLFDPLHITEVHWEWSPEGISCGGWGLYLQTESMAKFGQLLLDKGVWEGVQIIPEQWVEEMMKTHVESAGYGYQMWRCDNPETYRADGAYGQYIIVMPKEDMVAVIVQSFTSDAGVKEQRYLFDNLLPALSDTPLPESRSSRILARKQANYTLPLAEGKPASRALRSITGTENNYQLADNKLGWKSISLRQNGKTLAIAIETQKGVTEIACGYQEWTDSQVPAAFVPHARGATLGTFNGFTAPFTASGSYAWKTDKVLQANIYFVDWISGIRLQFDFNTTEPVLTIKLNYENSPFEISTTSLGVTTKDLS